MGLTVAIDERIASRTSRSFGATTVEAKKALDRAERKTARFAQAELLRRVKAATGIPQKFFKKHRRVFLRLRKGGRGVWLGTNEVPVEYLGRPMPGHGYITVNGVRYSRAWVNKHGAVMQRQGTARLPIVRVTEEVAPEVTQVLRGVARAVERRFEQLLISELDFVVHGRR